MWRGAARGAAFSVVPVRGISTPLPRPEDERDTSASARPLRVDHTAAGSLRLPNRTFACPLTPDRSPPLSRGERSTPRRSGEKTVISTPEEDPYKTGGGLDGAATLVTPKKRATWLSRRPTDGLASTLTSNEADVRLLSCQAREPSFSRETILELTPTRLPAWLQRTLLRNQDAIPNISLRARRYHPPSG